MTRIATCIATMGGLGHVPKGPGTAGSLAAIPLAWLLHWAGGFWFFAAMTLAALAAGWWATSAYVADRPAGADPSEVIVDELVGQWIALWPLSLGLTMAGAAPHVFPWPGWIGACVLFRLFDIWKPGPVGWAERHHGATGIMADDLVAGALAAVVVTAMAAAAHGWPA